MKKVCHKKFITPLFAIVDGVRPQIVAEWCRHVLMSNPEKQSFPKAMWLVLGAGLAARLYHIGVESAWTDELWAVQRAEGSLVEAVESQMSRADPNWVYDFILHGWIRLFGDSEYSTRLLSVIFGMLAIYGIYHVGRILFGRRTGTAAALLLSLSVLHIEFSQQARMYTISSCLALASFACFAKSLASPSIRYYFGWFLSTALAFYTHLLCAMTVIAQLIFLILRRKEIPASILHDFLILFLGLMLALNPCLYVILGESSAIRKVRSHFGQWPPPSLHDILNVLTDFSHRGKIPLDL